MPTHHLLIRDIYPETLSLLQRIYRYSRHHQVRQRAHCLILRHEGYSLSDLITIFKVSRKTLYNWLEAWDKRGFPGLYNRPGRGRKGTFTSDQKEQIRNWAQAHPKQLKQVLQKTLRRSRFLDYSSRRHRAFSKHDDSRSTSASEY